MEVVAEAEEDDAMDEDDDGGDQGWCGFSYGGVAAAASGHACFALPNARSAAWGSFAMAGERRPFPRGVASE